MQTQSETLAGDAAITGAPWIGSQAVDSEAAVATERAAARLDPRELEQHRQRLTRIAMWMLRNRAAAEDAVQETLLAALQSPQRFAGRSSVQTWLFAILKHKIADIFRMQSREQPLGDDDEPGSIDDLQSLYADDGHLRDTPSHWANPEEALTQRRFLEALERSIETLPRSAAQVFTMRELMGMETDEICRALDITANNCFVILHRARMALRARLERDWFSHAAAATR